MTKLSLTPEQLLTTTRSVRKRLDLTRPVEREVLEECLAIAQQAPVGSDLECRHFVIVTDPERRAALADMWRRGFEIYKTMPIGAYQLSFPDPARQRRKERMFASVEYLAEHLQEVPVHVIPCLSLNLEGLPRAAQGAMWGSIAPATWSFMLAARLRGLGTCWTNLHLFFEEEAAKLLGIAYPQVTQAALIPVAYTKGTDFRPTLRDPLETMVHWEQW